MSGDQGDTPNDEMRVVYERLVHDLSANAGPNGAQVQWFLGRLDAWSADAWGALALHIRPRGLVLRAGEAFEAMGADAQGTRASQSLVKWGGSAWSAAKNLLCAYITRP